MIIPYQNLSKDALLGILEETISREGTEYGETEYSMEQKIAQLMKQLETGKALVSYDEVTETCGLVSPDELA